MLIKTPFATVNSEDILALYPIYDRDIGGSYKLTALMRADKSVAVALWKGTESEVYGMYDVITERLTTKARDCMIFNDEAEEIV